MAKIFDLNSGTGRGFAGKSQNMILRCFAMVSKGFRSPAAWTAVSSQASRATQPCGLIRSFSTGTISEDAVASLIIASVGTGWAFLINGASFVAVLASLSLLRLHELHAKARVDRANGSFTEGFRYVGARPDLLAILVMLLLIGIFGLNFPIFISTMVVTVFHAGAGGYLGAYEQGIPSYSTVRQHRSGISG